MRLNGGDHQKKRFFANNSVEALIPFSEKHRGICNCMYLWGGVREFG